MSEEIESSHRQDINYRPQMDAEYMAALGGNYPGTATITSTDFDNTYANLNELKSNLATLNSNLQIIQSQLESALVNFSLPITQSDTDTVLRDAHSSVWPPQLSAQSPSFITYDYYKALGNIATAGAEYLRQRYEMALRDMNGNSALDLLNLNSVIQNESDLIGSFLDQYVGNVDDSSEFRILELFQDWVQNALGEAANVLQAFNNQDNLPALAPGDVQALDPTETSKSQALFQIKLNSLNEELVSNITLLKRNFSDYSDTFYNSFLGPALQTRLQVTRNFYPKPGVLGAEIQSMSSIMDNTYTSHLTDQLRRAKFFDKQVTTITNLIAMRDTYRSYISQLSISGTSPPSSGAGIVSTNGVSIDPSTISQLNQTVAATSTNNFQADHSQLTNVDVPDAHPQYVLNDGGEITGDLAVADGVTVGGIVPATHSHTGQDGSTQINGADIIPGTIPPGSIDASNRPDMPINLKLLRQIGRDAGSGTLVVDAEISWEGDEGNSYEVSVAAVPNA